MSLPTATPEVAFVVEDLAVNDSVTLKLVRLEGRLTGDFKRFMSGTAVAVHHRNIIELRTYAPALTPTAGVIEFNSDGLQWNRSTTEANQIGGAYEYTAFLEASSPASDELIEIRYRFVLDEQGGYSLDSDGRIPFAQVSQESETVTLPTGSVLNDLLDVAAPSPTDQDVVTWDNATSKWIAQAQAAASGLLAANNLSDVASAATSRTNLGVAIGSDVQAYAAALDAVSGTNTGDEVAASTSAAGVVELLTTAELDTGTDTTRAATAAAIENSARSTKLDGIETAATADQTGAEIKAAYEGEADTNAFDDAAVSKLAGIESAADVTDAVNVAAAGAPIITSGAGAPGSTPAAVGDIYIDTTGDIGWVAAGTASSADWKQATGAGGGDLLAANNLSDVDNAGTARTNLGLAIGSDVQAHSAVLDATTASFLIADETKLDGIETAADVTDATNVAAAGAHMSGGTDVPVADGGTGASTAAGARTNLDVDQAGTDNSTDVTLAGTPDYITLSGQVITRGLVDLTTDVTGDLPVAEGGTGSSTASAARTALGLAIGTDVQAYDAELAALAGLTSAADKVPYFTGSGTAGVADLTSAARDELAALAAPQTVSGTTDTLAAADARRLTMYSNASAVTVTVPTGTFAAGDWFLLQSTGAGGLSLSTSGITLNGSSPTTTAAQNAKLLVMFTASNTISVLS